MRFAFNTTLENPDFAKSYHQLLDDLREQAILCDQGGFDAFWLAEHHFGTNGRDNLPNPFMLATDLGSRTKRIKLGTAVVILPLWHPLRAAENIALLDQLLEGRLEIGFGRASQPHEVVTFNPGGGPTQSHWFAHPLCREPRDREESAHPRVLQPLGGALRVSAEGGHLVES